MVECLFTNKVVLGLNPVPIIYSIQLFMFIGQVSSFTICHFHIVFSELAMFICLLSLLLFFSFHGETPILFYMDMALFVISDNFIIAEI